MENPNNNSSPESSVERIINHNIEKMETEMRTLLMNESVGVNAGVMIVDGKRYGAAAANGYADQETGEISVFGNYQDVPKEVRQEKREFTLKVGYFPSDRSEKYAPIEIVRAADFSQEAKEALEQTVKKWNEEKRSL